MEHFVNINGKWVLSNETTLALKNITEEKKSCEKTEKQLKTDILDEYKKLDTTQKDFGGIKIAISSPVIELQFDLEKFIEENKELYIKYLVPVYKGGETRIIISKGGKK